MTAIEAQNLGKWYHRQGVGAPTLFGTLAQWGRRRDTEQFWALRSVDFTIERGRTVGVVGPNGSGKSSLLGLVAGTITPSEGTVRATGRISSLLELGAGFHPDLSGRENVFLNAAILGIPRADVRRRFDAIVDFAGLREFIDMPVKNYSTGMYARLGFATAIHLSPEILLIDEVLAVGDEHFQKKCLQRMGELRTRGTTIVLVSHSMETVKSMCDRACLLLNGRLVTDGPPERAIERYREALGTAGASA